MRLTGSTAIRADALHYASDILMNIGVIAALALAMTVGWGLADPIIALVIAAVIIHAAVRVARNAIQQLMDREFPEQDRERIRQIVLEHPDVLNCHDLRTRRSGIDSFIQVHVEMDSSLTLLRAHEISDDVEARIRKSTPTRRSLSTPTRRASRSPCRASPGADADLSETERGTPCRDGRAGRWDSRPIGTRRAPRLPPPTR